MGSRKFLYLLLLFLIINEKCWATPPSPDYNIRPAIASDGSFYFGQRDGTLHALNPNGSLKWKFKTPYGQVPESPSVSEDGIVYVSNGDGYLYALNPDGSQKWKYPTGSRGSSSPVISPDGIVFISGDGFYNVDEHISSGGAVYAFSPEGSLIWKFLNSFQYGFLVPRIESNQNIAFIGCEEMSEYLCTRLALYSVNILGGLNWKFDLGGGSFWAYNIPPLISPDGQLYLYSISPGRLYALSSAGDLLWKSEIWGYPPLFSADGTVYVFCDENNLCALDSQGNLKWKNASKGLSPFWNTVDSDGMIYIGCNKSICAISSEGSFKLEFNLNTASVCVPTASRDGAVYAFCRLRDKLFVCAFDTDGTLKWKLEISWFRSFPKGITIGSDGTIYFVRMTGLGKFVPYAVNPDGTLKWEFKDK